MRSGVHVDELAASARAAATATFWNGGWGRACVSARRALEHASTDEERFQTQTALASAEAGQRRAEAEVVAEGERQRAAAAAAAARLRTAAAAEAGQRRAAAASETDQLRRAAEARAYRVLAERAAAAVFIPSTER